MKLEHVAINVPEPVKAVQWYCDHLGMKVVLASGKSPWRHFIADSTGTSLIEFYGHRDIPMPDYVEMHPRTLHLGFTAENLEADRARLIAAGAVPIGEIKTSPSGGERKAFLRDPWGVALQLVERVKPLVG